MFLRFNRAVLWTGFIFERASFDQRSTLVTHFRLTKFLSSDCIDTRRQRERENERWKEQKKKNPVRTRLSITIIHAHTAGPVAQGEISPLVERKVRPRSRQFAGRERNKFNDIQRLSTATFCFVFINIDIVFQDSTGQPWANSGAQLCLQNSIDMIN